MDLAADERLLLSQLDENYLLTTMRELMADEVVTGSSEELAHAEYIADRMCHAGLEGGGETGDLIETFPVFGWRELGSSVTLIRPEEKAIPCKQGYKGDGTGPTGVSAAVVDLGGAGWDDFQGNEVHGKIVLIERGPSWSDPLGGLPALMEAKTRGAVGALIASPFIAYDDLRADPVQPSLPCVNIANKDSVYLRNLLADGSDVMVQLVIDNQCGHYARGRNVVGMIRGREYPDEYVYLSAHYDHWFADAGASDDSAGVATVLTIAEAFRKAGVSPRRSLVFCAWGAEELGGPVDSSYDWCVGSCSHIAATLQADGSRAPALHPDRVGRIAAMLNMDEVGSRGGIAHLQATPDLQDFYSGVARHVISGQRIDSDVTPPAAYDNWPFFAAGVPCAQIAWRGEAHDAAIHTARDTLDELDPEYLRLNAAFNAVALLRLASADVLPYGLSRNRGTGERGVNEFVARSPEASVREDAGLAGLRDAIQEYGASAERVEASRSGVRPTGTHAARVNASLMEAAAGLNPRLYFCDMTVTPAWGASFVLEQYGKDLQALTEAITHLRAGRREEASASLAKVTTMGWGHRVGEEAYGRILDLISHTPHKWWAEGFIPRLVTVHEEYRRVSSGRAGVAEMSAMADALERKREDVVQSVGATACETGSAYRAAAQILASVAAQT